MNELLEKIRGVFNACMAKDAEYTARLSAVADREAAVDVREKRATVFENAEAAFAAADTQKAENMAEIERIKESHIKLDNWAREERAAVATEIARLAPLHDQEQQLFKDRQALYAREAALEVEKRDYKVRYIAKIKAHFANTGGAPDPDSIT